VYVELRVFIDVLGIGCIVLGITLFAGTKRETLWDRDNLVGLLLVGVALSTHGGFDTILRSSPRAPFSGYVTTLARRSDDVGSASMIYVCDLGYPPESFASFVAEYPKAQGSGAPCQALYIPAKSGLPDAAWNTDMVWLLRTVYRTRDFQVTRIDGEPVPSAKASGIQSWTWQRNEPVLRPTIEAATGFTLMLGAAFALLRRKRLDAASLQIGPFVDRVRR
jgi:hypothetical protein